MKSYKHMKCKKDVLVINTQREIQILQVGAC